MVLTIDECVWLSIVNGYYEPTITVNDITTPKPLTVWDRGDYEIKGWNNKALSTIFNGVTLEEIPSYLCVRLLKRLGIS